MRDEPYATAQAFYERSNTANPDTDFADLNRSDFILAVGRVTRRKLHAVSRSYFVVDPKLIHFQ